MGDNRKQLNVYWPRHFSLYEYVPRAIYKQFGDASIWFINPRLMQMDDALREYFNVPVTINNWFWGGEREDSGYRTPFSLTGAVFSQHRLGNGSDKKFKGLDPILVQTEIIANRKLFPWITAIEIGVPWVHTDVRPSWEDDIMQFDAAGRRIG